MNKNKMKKMSRLKHDKPKERKQKRGTEDGGTGCYWGPTRREERMERK